MLKNFLNQLKPQDVSSREAQASFRILQTALLVSLFGAIGTLISIVAIGNTMQAYVIMIVMTVLLLVSYILLRLRILLPARIVPPFALLTAIVLLMIVGSGLHDVSLIAYGGIIILASLTLGPRAAYGFTVLIIASVFGIGLAEMNGWLVTDASALTTLDDPFLIAVVVFTIAFMQSILINRLNANAQEARENERAQVEANRELTALKDALENRVITRTQELEKRAAQLEAVSSVAYSISAAQELEQLLPAICRIVSERFGHYHTGIFLLDEQSEYAVLRATNSVDGRRMLERGHCLRVGATGLVGYVSSHGEPRIAGDVEADAVYYHNPDLPNTRTEAALPLKIGGNTIGVLDVQSTDINAFRQEDIEVLGVLGNQIAIAIENARLFSQTKQALEEARTFHEQYVKQDWERFSRQVQYAGYRYDGIRTTPFIPMSGKPDEHVFQIPIKVRNLVVGYVNLRSNNPSRQWTEDELRVAQSAAERAGLAIENARLLNEAQRRAAKERAVGEIVSKIGASVNMNAIVRTAVEELGRALPGSEVVIQFENKEK